MKKILYHGSEFLIEKPEFGKGARHNDYGRGFYCTENIELAREWACAKQKNGYVNIYELDMEGLKVLNLNDSKYHILNWLAILADNRTYWQNGSIAEEAKKYIKEHFLIDITPYDIIVGYRAEIYYIKKAEREREARREYRRRKKESADIHELFMLDIMREGMENGDTRLFR